MAKRTPLQYAETILKGRIICGVLFGPLLQVVFETTSIQGSRVFDNRQASLLLSTRWKLLSSDQFKDCSTDFACEELSVEQQLALLYACADATILDVNITLERPALILFLSNAKVVVIDGFDELFETWSFGTSDTDGARIVQVWACPGGQLSCLDTEAP